MRRVMFAVIPSPLFAIVFWLMTPFCQPTLNRVSSAKWKRQTPRIRPGDRRMRSPCIPSVLIRPSRLYTTLKRRAYAAVR
jgi:hypothetical protein